jgi:glycosyltransferase involved in cell wall biosynthesis
VRVLHILNELRPSGAETMLRLTAAPMRARGVELHILTIGADAGPYAEALGSAGFEVHHIPFRPIGSFVGRYLALLERSRFDVVHVHPERANFHLALLARFARAGVVRTIHSVFPFEGRLRIERQVQRNLLRLIGVAQVAIGESVQDRERLAFRNPTRVIYNTFDETRFRLASDRVRAGERLRLGIDEGAFVVVVVGNCSAVKNRGIVFEALALTGAPDATVLHVGLERESETGERSLVDRLGVADRVRFLGFVEDVPAVLHAADAFVMPSTREGFGVAALETLGCGVPTVLADVPGLRDLRPHLPSAWYVPPEPVSVSAALQEIADLDEDARRRWSRSAAETVREHFGVERHVAAYHDLYRSVARRRRR